MGCTIGRVRQASPGYASNGFSVQRECIFNCTRQSNIMDRYEILKEIGGGTYGIVYKARDKEHNQKVAIKQFRSSEDDTLAKRELDICSMLSHPNIITFVDSFRFDGLLHLVFDFATTDLGKLIAKYPKGMEVKQATKITYQICKAIHCCHRQKIMHRDVKPENILIDNKGDVKLCDFGVARTVQYGGPLTDYVSTRWYRPPEQELRCTNYSFKSDIWSIGVIAFEILTGKPLFPGETQLEQLSLIQNMCGPLPKSLSDKFPSGFQYGESKCRLEDRMRRNAPLEALDFISETLNMYSEKRPSAEECLDHMFFHDLRRADLVKQSRQNAERDAALEDGGDDIEEEITYQTEKGRRNSYKLDSSEIFEESLDGLQPESKYEMNTKLDESYGDIKEEIILDAEVASTSHRKVYQRRNSIEYED